MIIDLIDVEMNILSQYHQYASLSKMCKNIFIYQYIKNCKKGDLFIS